MAGVDLTNCYTDYGFWPFAVFLPLFLLAAVKFRAVADVLGRFVGPIRGQPGEHALHRIRKSRAFEWVVRAQVLFLFGGAFLAGVLALVGLLPCD